MERLIKIKKDDNELELYINDPSLEDHNEATKVYNAAFHDAIKSRALIRAKLDDFLVEQGLWDDNKKAKLTSLQKDILESERAIDKGGIKLSKAREIALKLRKLRQELKDLITVRTELDDKTAEGQADNARFNYLVWASLVYNNDRSKRYYDTYNQFLNNQNSQEVSLAIKYYIQLLYGWSDDNLTTENKFLKDYKFVDDKLRLINPDGHLVDEDGRLIDEFGRFVKYEDGQKVFIDLYGNPLDDEGNYKFEKQPFLDDEGNPIT